jgi:acetylornithine/succinyldiaminopimelate/putrescine aminotransferase
VAGRELRAAGHAGVGRRCWRVAKANGVHHAVNPGIVWLRDCGLLVETAGPRSEVVKLLPPLTVTDEELDQGLERLAEAVHAVC